MQERARRSPSIQGRSSQTREYPSNSDPTNELYPSPYSVSGRVVTDIVFSNALLVASLWTVREWLLSQNVGAFWVVMRVLACGALGLVVRETASGNAQKAWAAASSAKVRVLYLPSTQSTVVMSSSHPSFSWLLWHISSSKAASSLR